MGKLKGHVLIFGYLHIGSYVAEKLDEIGIDYVVTTEAPTLPDLLKQEDPRRPRGRYPADQGPEEAGIESASMVVVTHSSAPTTCSSSSAQEAPARHPVVAVVRDEALVEPRGTRADIVIAASVTIGHLLALSAVTKTSWGSCFSERSARRDGRVLDIQVLAADRQGAAGVTKLARDHRGGSGGTNILRDALDPGFELQRTTLPLAVSGSSRLSGSLRAKPRRTRHRPALARFMPFI